MSKITKSIIIPFYDCFDLVVQRLAELSSLKLPKDVEVILVNDGSEDIKTLLLLERARLTFPFFTSVGFDKNRGFSSANNLGAETARGDILYFLSDDVRILKPFWNILNAPVMINAVVGGRYLDYDTGWNKFNEIVIYYLEGWFLALPHKQFDNLGGWDVNFNPHDYEDIDLSLRARLAGLDLRTLSSGYLQHLGCGTIGRKKDAAERCLITERNRKYFMKKWESHLQSAVIA